MVTPRGNKELPGERDNAKEQCQVHQARTTTHGLDGQNQYVDRTSCGRVNKNHRGQR